MGSLEQKTYADYTVGWVCALIKEQTAAEGLLDKRHADLLGLPDDSNSYSLGSIGGHNIAIACLGAGDAGISPATSVAVGMIRTFPKIRIGLMVGIGGGIPSKVRLGDVVVSVPVGTYGGVVQWDFGKEEKDGFKEKGFLQSPPTILRTALSRWATNARRLGSKIPQYLHELQENCPGMVGEYTLSEHRQDPERQRDLLSAAGAHPTANSNELKQGFFTSVNRQGLDGHLRVVYGLIGSGNKVIKRAALRDELSERYGGELACVEMESAGLMNHFPCLVIRGICDYADERKNDDWHDYAAARAAAFAKELLQYIPPSQVKEGAAVNDVTSQIKDAMEKIQRTQNQEKHGQYLDWLSDVDYGKTHSKNFEKRKGNTGTWFLESPRFLRWQHGDKQTLLCTGIPGAGKTVMTSIVIEALGYQIARNPPAKNTELIGVAYIYCNYSATSGQELQDLLASLLKQLARGLPKLEEDITRLWDRRMETGTKLSCWDLEDQLRLIMMKYSKVFILIDALDECPISSRTVLLDGLMQLQKTCNLNIFVTSRHDPDIDSYFEPEQIIELEANSQDVSKYLECCAHGWSSCAKSDGRIKKVIITSIVEGVKGMFLLAALCSELLKGVVSQNDIQACISAFSIGRTPTGSQQTQSLITPAYDFVQERIFSESQNPNKRVLARKVLGWITFARRPLTVTELRDAIATKPGTAEFDEGDLPSTEDILSVCSGLVLVGEGDIIRLVHYTTQVYFAENWQHLFPGFHFFQARICLTYLSFEEFDTGPCSSKEEYRERTNDYPFYEYAAQFLGSHLIPYHTAAPEVMYFLRNKGKVTASHQANIVSMIYSYHPGYDMTGLQFAALHGLEPAVREFLAPTDPSLPRESAIQTDKHGNTLMFLAAKNGHCSVVSLLLQAGFGVNQPVSHNGRTAIQIAAANGHAQLVERLLMINANVDYQPTPLILAVQNGHLGVVKLLLSRKPYLEAPFIYNYGLYSERTVLQIAAEYNRIEIIDELLAAGADVNRPAAGLFRARTALQAASERGEVKVVKRLLDAGADINAAPGQGVSGRTALQAASENGHVDVMQMLLRRGADVNAPAGPDRLGKTALQAAATQGEIKAVDVLLLWGADINAAAGPRLGRTAHQAIGESNDCSIQWALQEAGLKYDVDNPGEAQEAPHIHATHAELLDIAIMLRPRESEISAESEKNVNVVSALLAQLVGDAGEAKWMGALLENARYFIHQVLNSIIVEQPVNYRFLLLALAMKDLGQFERLLDGAVQHGGLRTVVWYPRFPRPGAWPSEEGMVEALEKHGKLFPDFDDQDRMECD